MKLNNKYNSIISTLKKKIKKLNYKTIFIYVMAIIVMSLNFYCDIFHSNKEERKEFQNFQNDSEDLVIGGIIKDKYKTNTSKWTLQSVDNVKKSDNSKYNDILINGDTNISTTDYKSQFGLQGKIFSFLYNKLGIQIKVLHLICSILLAIVLLNICRLLKEKYGNLFALIFYVVFLLSPWIARFADNLYWVEFTWFLPLMFCLLLYKSKSKKYILLIFLSVLIKCLCGYEYITTILLTSITFLIADFILNKQERKQNFKMLLMVGIVSLLGFIVALCMHAYIREDGNILKGIKTIYREDVMRRTISNDSSQFDNKKIKKSINASYFEVIKKYFNFKTDIIIGIDGNLFNLMCISAAIISLYKIIKNKKDAKQDFILYLIFLLGPLSWFILGKAHSYIHTHINFVLWYFGYIQICIYIVIKFILNIIKNYKKGEEVI